MKTDFVMPIYYLASGRSHVSKNYLNNKKLYECIVDYTARCREAEANNKPKPPIPDYVGECIVLICTKMGTRHNFSGYSYREEMIGDAIVDCVNAFYNFDSDRFDNPFGYFSMVGWRAMVRKIFTEKRETYLKYKSLQNAFLSGEHIDSPDGWSDSGGERVGAGGSEAVDYKKVSDQVVNDFEDLLDRRKKSRSKEEVQ